MHQSSSLGASNHMSNNKNPLSHIRKKLDASGHELQFKGEVLYIEDAAIVDASFSTCIIYMIGLKINLC